MKRRSVFLFIGVVGSFVRAELPVKQVAKQVSELQRKEPSFTGKDLFDPQKKRQEVLDLVTKGSNFLAEHSFIEFARRVNYTSEFKSGELYLFVYSEQGKCLAHGTLHQLMWLDLKNRRDLFGTYFVKKIIENARRGGGWTVYEWQGATKISYSKMVEKEGKKYIIGCGYFPHSKEDAAVTLVRGALSTFCHYRDRDSLDEAFGEFSFLGGNFIYGDLTLQVFDKDFIVRANGRDPSEVGLSYWDTKNRKGAYIFRAIPEQLNAVSLGEGRWFEYEWYNAPMRSYAERVLDKEGNPYFIVCGYYPQADQKMALELVKQGKKALKERGLVAMASIINDWGNKEFVYGRMGLFIYGLDGTVIADSERPSVAGKNALKERDDSGYLYVEDMLDMAQKQPFLWISYRTKRSVCSVYAETIELEGKKYLVGTGFFPITKESSMVLLVKNALGLLESVSETTAFKAFSNYKGNYVVGDLTVFVYGLDGTCYADGLDEKNVWRNMLQDLDEEGRPYVKIMINEGKKGPAKVIFKQYGARMVSYVEPLKKGDKTFIVGSGYFL